MKKTFIFLFGLIMLSCSISPCGPKLKLRVFVPPLSKHARTMLCKYDDYVIHDIVFEMMLSDVERVVGELPRSTRYDRETDSPTWDYKNLVLLGYAERSQGDDQIMSIAVVSGKYLGLTVGQSTKTDADCIFGRKANDLYESARFGHLLPHGEQWDPKYMRSVYDERNGAIVVVYYENNIVTTITVAKEMGV